MESQTKQCQNCKEDFVIEPDDFAFYEKIKVPPPTFCPECRRQRRFTWRNERTLYKRRCDLCQTNIIGLYPAGTKFPVYCNTCWFSDKWNPEEYAKDYDFQKPFFEQFKELNNKVPRLAVWVQQSTNSEYTNQSYSNKNVHLSFAIRDSEDTSYCCRAVELKKCTDNIYTHHSELLYQCIDTDKSYHSRYLQEAENCIDSALLFNARNCQNCFGGVNLRSASHVFFGEQLDKNTYEERIKNFDLGSFKANEEMKEKFNALRLKSIFRFANLKNTINSKGDHLSNAKNCHYVFDGFELENVRYSSWVFTSKEVSDCYGMGSSEFIYDCIGVESVNNVKFSSVTDETSYAQYADMCSGCNNIFGCVGLRQKEYCILNKQYTKEEYEALVPKIIEHMNQMPHIDSKGRIYKYGEFFPAEFSVFAYNETVAQENHPLSKELAQEGGYSWREPERRNYAIDIKAEDLPDNTKDISVSIVDKNISCLHGGTCNDQCSEAFRITSQEFQFYQQMNLPVPRLCPNCRHYERLKQRNPVKLWHRKCMKPGCNNEFETSYAPERPEIIYCEKCYQQEVV